jgi:hypothetical protein
VLDASCVVAATRDPEAFWAAPAVPVAPPLRLAAHALAFVDWD